MSVFDMITTAMRPLYSEELENYAHFLAQPEYNFGIPVVYLVSVLLGAFVMRFIETPFTPPDWFKMVYNFTQVSVSVYCALYGLSVVADMLNHPFGVNLPMDSWSLHYCICVHFLSKFLDYVDTFLIVVGKKHSQLTVLHVYHHFSISMVWGYLIHSGYANGTVCFGAWINAIIHSIMYSYFGLTSASWNGKRLFNTRPFRVWVTRIQLFQFFMCIAHAVTVMVIPNLIPMRLAYLQFGYHCTMITLFGNFYYQQYANKKKNKSTKKQE